MIGISGVRPEGKRVKAVQNYPVPKTTQELKWFLGLAGYYKRFIPNFSRMVEPLTELLKKNTPYEWDDKRDKAFNILMEALAKEPLGLARTSGFLLQRWNSRSGRLFLACAHGRWKKRYVRTFSSRSGAVQCVRYASMDFVESAAVCALLLRIRAKRRKRFWVHPLVSQRLLKGQFHKLYEDLRMHPMKFFGYFRMTSSTFDELLFTIEGICTTRRKTGSNSKVRNNSFLLSILYFINHINITGVILVWYYTYIHLM